MGVGYNPKIITDGLVMCLDAANVKSYSGSGSTWTDLSGKGNHLTLIGSPTLASKVLQFDGSTQYGENFLNLSTGSSTIMSGARYTAASPRGRIVNARSNNWLLGHYSGTTENFYAGAWVSTASSGPNDSNWRIHTGISNVTLGSYSLYVNSNLIITNANGNAGPNGIAVGKYGGGATEWSACEVSFVLAYNRTLSTAEVLQNYNALRGRFGI